MQKVAPSIILVAGLLVSVTAPSAEPAAPAARTAAPASPATPATNGRAQESGEMEQLRLQSQQERTTKAQQTTSNILKKQSDTDKAVRSNVK